MTTTKPADARPRCRRPARRPREEASTWESRSDARSLDPDAPTGPVSAVLTLLLGALELLAALFSWADPSGD